MTNIQTSKYHTKALLLMSLSQENAVNLHSLGRVPYHFAITVRGKYTQPVENMSLYQRMTFFKLVTIC